MRCAAAIPGFAQLADGADLQAVPLADGRGDGLRQTLSLHWAAETSVAMSALDLTLFEKQVRGSLFGSSNPRADIPRMLELHRSGQLKLEELRTRTYSLDEINAGYDDMRDGRNLRGVITF